MSFSNLFFIFLTFSAIARASLYSAKRAPVLIYNAYGTCYDCAEAPARVAQKLGYKSRFMGVADINRKNLSEAKLWIQPGGDALMFASAIPIEKMKLLEEFVRKGGAYIGFCAGAFLADTNIADSGFIGGLGLIPGSTYDFLKTQKPQLLPVDWLGKTRYLYYQAGPAFSLTAEGMMKSKILARYSDGSIAAISTSYGRGRVILTGPHPEATPEWLEEDNLIDPDGDDINLAEQLIELAFER